MPSEAEAEADDDGSPIGRRYTEDENMAAGLTTNDPAGDFLRLAPAPQLKPSKNFIDTRAMPESPHFPIVGEGHPPPHPDKTRQTITYGLLVLVALVVATYFGFLGADLVKSDSAGEMFDRVFPGLLGLAGTAMGFYFGDRTQGHSDR